MGHGYSSDKPLTTGQIARYCHVTNRGVLKWIESGKLQSYRTPGKHNRVSVGNFVRFLKEYRMPIPSVFKMKPRKSTLYFRNQDHEVT